MRTKTRTTAGVKPGMVIRLDFSTGNFQQVATVQRGPWPRTRHVTFTDGTSQWYSLGTGWTVARGKATRNAVRARASLISSHALADALALVGSYALAA